MAKDDYHVIVYRVLVYLYACMKREILFDKSTFNAAVKKDVGSEEYFTDVLQMMQEDGLIRGLCFTRAWGGATILASDVRSAAITSKGIQYLQDNSMMAKVGKLLRESADIIASLAALILD